MKTVMRRINGKLLGLAGGLLLLMATGVVHAGTVTYVYTDPQGTPLAEADVNGNITATFDYAPYGSQALGMAPNGPGYTGHVNDPDTGFVYMQARYYDPSVGRFLSVDPGEKTPVDGLYVTNRYSYANNNPNRYVDPDGRQAFEVMTSDPVLRVMARPSLSSEAIREGIRNPVPRTAQEDAEELARQAGLKPSPKPSQWRTETPPPWTPPDVMKGQFTHWDDAPDVFRLFYHLMRILASGHPTVIVGPLQPAEKNQKKDDQGSKPSRSPTPHPSPLPKETPSLQSSNNCAPNCA